MLMHNKEGRLAKGAITDGYSRANHLSEILFVSPDLTRTLTAAGMPEFLEIAFFCWPFGIHMGRIRSVDGEALRTEVPG
jgi:hypothetical protein